jgi:hypothetical protein
VGGGSVRYSKLLHPAPLSSRGLGRRPLTAVTRVRIPVAVLKRKPRNSGVSCLRVSQRNPPNSRSGQSEGNRRNLDAI